MTDDTETIPKPFQNHPTAVPRGMRPYDIEALVAEQQGALNDLKLRVLRSDHQYLSWHPEVGAIAKYLLMESLTLRPRRVQEYLAELVLRPDFAKQIERIVLVEHGETPDDECDDDSEDIDSDVEDEDFLEYTGSEEDLEVDGQFEDGVEEESDENQSHDQDKEEETETSTDELASWQFGEFVNADEVGDVAVTDEYVEMPERNGMGDVAERGGSVEGDEPAEGVEPLEDREIVEGDEPDERSQLVESVQSEQEGLPDNFNESDK